MKTGAAFSDEGAKVLIADTLRMFVGLGKRFSWADLALVTGDDERKLRSYVEADPATMPAPVFFRVFMVLPPEAFARIAMRMGFAACPADEDGSEAIGQVLAETAALVASGTAAMADGKIDHRERAALRQQAAGLLPALQALARDGGN